jgi:hypothetical protein
MFLKICFGTFLVTNSNKISKKVPTNIFIHLCYHISCKIYIFEKQNKH